jgi:hypothetical protein
MNFKTHAPARREGTTLQPNIHTIDLRVDGRLDFSLTSMAITHIAVDDPVLVQLALR